MSKFDELYESVMNEEPLEEGQAFFHMYMWDLLYGGSGTPVEIYSTMIAIMVGTFGLAMGMKAFENIKSMLKSKLKNREYKKNLSTVLDKLRKLPEYQEWKALQDRVLFSNNDNDKIENKESLDAANALLKAATKKWDKKDREILGDLIPSFKK
jgi:hypothetical protein